MRLIRDPGVAAVPGSSFFSRPELGRTKLRFAFPKRLETLAAAAERLAPDPRARSSPPARTGRAVERGGDRPRVSARVVAHERVRFDDVLGRGPAVAARYRTG